MEKKYDGLFKFEPFKNDLFSYTILRRNFSGKLQKVAEAKIIPNERLDISYSKDLKKSEKAYIEEHLNELVNLVIKPSKKSSVYYTIYRKNPSGVLEVVAIATLTTGYEISCVKSLNSNETTYLGNYFRNLLKQNSNK